MRIRDPVRTPEPFASGLKCGRWREGPEIRDILAAFSTPRANRKRAFAKRCSPHPCKTGRGGFLFSVVKGERRLLTALHKKRTLATLVNSFVDQTDALQHARSGQKRAHATHIMQRA
jgi:hypothetical protein